MDVPEPAVLLQFLSDAAAAIAVVVPGSTALPSQADCVAAALVVAAGHLLVVYIPLMSASAVPVTVLALVASFAVSKFAISLE